MACNSSSWTLLLFVAIIGLASCLQVYCVQNMTLLEQLNSANLSYEAAGQMLNAVEDKDQVELGRYTVEDILAITNRSVANCLGENVTNYRIAMDYYVDNHGLLKFYIFHYNTLIYRCVHNIGSVIDKILLRLTNTDLSNLITFAQELPANYLFMFEGAVSKAVSTYMRVAMGNRTISNSYLKLGLREELEASCKRLLRDTNSFAIFRLSSEWHNQISTASIEFIRWDKAIIGCQIYLEKLAPSVL